MNPPASLVTPPAIIRKNRGWLLALGILLVILGFVGLGSTFAFTLATTVLFAVLLLVGGFSQLVEAFQCGTWKARIWHLIVAALYLVAGIAMWRNPLLGSALLTAVIGGSLVGSGIVRIGLAFAARQSNGWIWLALAGLTSLVLGILILAHWPASSLFIIGLFIAIELLMSGFSCILLSLALRGADPAAAPN